MLALSLNVGLPVWILNVGRNGLATTRLDFIFSIGVIQIIPDPLPTLDNIRDYLAERGKIASTVSPSGLKSNTGKSQSVLTLAAH